MSFKILPFILVCFITFNGLFSKDIKVVCSTSDIAWLAKKIGKDKVTVTALSDGNDDPHYLDVTPKSIKVVSEADVLCFVGLELEIGWLPKVIQKSGNSKIKLNQTGYCDCSVYVQVLEKPNGPVDRSMGHVHSGGNPHYQLDPQQMIFAAKAILETLIKTKAEEKDYFNKNFELLNEELTKLKSDLQEKTKKLGKMKVTQYHTEMSYLIATLELSSFEAIEKVPGVSPSAERLFSFGNECKTNGVTLCLATKHSPINKLKKFNSISQIPFIQERVSLINFQSEDAYEKMMNELVDKIIQTQSEKK